MMVECGMFVYARYVYQYSDDEALKNLMKAMYHYNNAAIEYFYFLVKLVLDIFTLCLYND